MTSANGGTYAGKYLRDGWVHNLEVTQFFYTTFSFFFLIQGGHLNKTINYSRHENVLKRHIFYLFAV